MFITFLVIFLSTFIGSMTGLGGGVIIKPLLSITTDYTVIVTNFFSSLAIFFMCLYSLIHNRRSNQEIDYKIIYSISLGAFAGGVIGSKLLIGVINQFNDESVLKFQLIMLIIVMLSSVIVTLFVKETAKRSVNVYITILIGVISGIVSSFLGIGGGIINIPILLLVFKETPKKAIMTSLVIVFVSQVATLFTFILDGVLASVEIYELLIVSVSGVVGGIVGKKVFKLMSSKAVRILYVCVLSSIIIVNILKII